MGSKKPRIDTNPLQSGLQQPFGGLNLAGLPAGPEIEPVPEAQVSDVKRGRVVLRRETAHRNGKAVIVVDQFEPQISDGLIEEIARKLRVACGVGGTIRNRSIEIQGDNAAKIREVLKQEGFRVAGIE